MRFLLIVLSLIISVGIGFIVMQLPKFLGMQSNYTMEILFGTRLTRTATTWLPISWALGD